MSGNYHLVYYDDAEKLRFIGILAYPKTMNFNKKAKNQNYIYEFYIVF